VVGRGTRRRTRNSTRSQASMYCPLTAQRSTINVSHILLLRIPNADLLRPSIRYFEISNMSSIASVMWKVSKRRFPVTAFLAHPTPFLFYHPFRLPFVHIRSLRLRAIHRPHRGAVRPSHHAAIACRHRAHTVIKGRIKGKAGATSAVRQSWQTERARTTFVTDTA
jgi:hypothetical protein